MNPRIWLAAGSFYGFLGVALGAFGAHGLKDRLDPPMLGIYRTAVEYQFYHAMALIAVGLWSAQQPSKILNGAGWCFSIGVVLFSGSLYALSISGVKLLGAVTPLGGFLFLVAWGLLVWNAIRSA